MVLIKAENLIKRFGDVTVIDGISLEICEGQFVSVVGSSGSGKTTLISMLSTFLPPTEGKIIVCGVDICGYRHKAIRDLRRYAIGYCYQSGNLIAELTVKQNILLPLSLNGGATDKKLYDYLVETLGLTAHLNKPPQKLSGGEAQRVAIARSLIKKPKIVFLDEPIGNLDSKNGEMVIGLLHKLNKDLGTALVQVTHNLVSTKDTCVIEIKDGKIIGTSANSSGYYSNNSSDHTADHASGSGIGHIAGHTSGHTTGTSFDHSSGSEIDHIAGHSADRSKI